MRTVKLQVTIEIWADWIDIEDTAEILACASAGDGAGFTTIEQVMEEN